MCVCVCVRARVCKHRLSFASTDSILKPLQHESHPRPPPLPIVSLHWFIVGFNLCSARFTDDVAIITKLVLRDTKLSSAKWQDILSTGRSRKIFAKCMGTITGWGRGTKVCGYKYKVVKKQEESVKEYDKEQFFLLFKHELVMV